MSNQVNEGAKQIKITEPDDNDWKSLPICVHPEIYQLAFNSHTIYSRWTKPGVTKTNSTHYFWNSGAKDVKAINLPKDMDTCQISFDYYFFKRVVNYCKTQNVFSLCTLHVA